jgi:hypothetical protein
MTIQDLGALGDMIGGVAVVASLIYLAIQIRQNTRQISQNIEATRFAAFERNIESANRMRELLILNPDLIDLFLRGSRDFEALDSSERMRFDLLMRNTMTAFQGAFLRQRMIGGDPLDFEGAGRLIDSILESPGARAWLEQGDFDWRPEFQAFIDERLAEVKQQATESGESVRTGDAAPDPGRSAG